MPIRPRKDPPLRDLIITFPILKQHGRIHGQIRRRIPHNLMLRRPPVIKIPKVPLALRLPYILVLLDCVQVDLIFDTAGAVVLHAEVFLEEWDVDQFALFEERLGGGGGCCCVGVIIGPVA